MPEYDGFVVSLIDDTKAEVLIQPETAGIAGAPSVSTKVCHCASSSSQVIMALTDYGELCVCQITELLGHTTATVSRHMSVLQNAGLVKIRKEGRWVYYRLSEAFPRRLLQWLKDAAGNADEIVRDKEKIRTIVSKGLDALCKTQRTRRQCQTA